MPGRPTARPPLVITYWSSWHEELVAALAAPHLRVVLPLGADAGLDGHAGGAARRAPPAPRAARRRRRPRPRQQPPPPGGWEDFVRGGGHRRRRRRVYSPPRQRRCWQTDGPPPCRHNHGRGEDCGGEEGGGVAAAPARPPPAAHGAHIAAGEELAGSCTRSIDRRSRSSFKSANHDARCRPVDASSVCGPGSSLALASNGGKRSRQQTAVVRCPAGRWPI